MYFLNVGVMHFLKDLTLYFHLFYFAKKSNLHAKITLSQKKFVSKLSCKQTARLLYSTFYQ